ncbi:MAG: imidazole glycerol phosphate synthase subunit HisH [Verrucomicrobiales bacterium]|nr:imidazole glycerol phosphate synthase subunit HisH [Verrucomicrobiales bacterium]
MNESGKIGVIDYGGGNLQNVLNGLKLLGHEGSLIDGPDDLRSVEKLIFPGVGAFGDCAKTLDQKNLRDGVLGWLREERPFFGICLGYQVLFESSEETPDEKGLGFLAGQVRKFPAGNGLKVPHMGWNTVSIRDRSLPVWEGLPEGEDPHLYFVHSFFPDPEDANVIGSTANYGVEFASSVQVGKNIFACQFHPERSQNTGLRLLKNFLES